MIYTAILTSHDSNILLLAEWFSHKFQSLHACSSLFLAPYTRSRYSQPSHHTQYTLVTLLSLCGRKCWGALMVFDSLEVYSWNCMTTPIHQNMMRLVPNCSAQPQLLDKCWYKARRIPIKGGGGRVIKIPIHVFGRGCVPKHRRKVTLYYMRRF